MNSDEYKNLIADMLCRPDVVAAGTMARHAAHCILALAINWSEAKDPADWDAIEALEEAAGIKVIEDR